MRTKKFYVVVRVSEEFRKAEPEMVETLVSQQLTKAAGRLRGPRGGRYEAVGDLFDFRVGQTTDDFIQEMWTYSAHVLGKYVRPHRS